MVSSSASSSRATGPRAERFIILLIDSDEDFRNGLAENLRDDGHEVREYERPADVPSLATLGPVNAVVIGHQNSPQDGLTFADEFHSLYASAPIVVVASCWNQNVEIQAAERAFLNLRKKPIDYDELHALLRQTGQARTLETRPSA